ncbi:MAG: alpha/beta hydrolase [Treponemataceae bacterium]|nr:alpha/beta hydrolase [Treponemataceae bacterium]
MDERGRRMVMRINGHVQLEDTEMYYVAFGQGQKKLVILPGLSDGLTTVKGKAFLLSGPYKRFLKDYTVFMFSRKNKMPEGYTIRQMAQDQVKAMKLLGIEKACILGVSQGGMISQYIAIDFPEVVEKLVLTVTVPYANDIVTKAVSSWIEMAEKGDHLSLMVDTAEKMYSQAYLEKKRKLFPLIARFTKPKSYERFLRNAKAILQFDARQELCKITCPTLIVAGDDDNTVGNDSPYQLKEGIKKSQLFIYKGLGHAAFEEGKGFYDMLYDFCEKPLSI